MAVDGQVELPYQVVLSQLRPLAYNIHPPDPPVPLTNPDHVDAEDLVCALGGERDGFQEK